jgi:capsular exopolysaccharide synthesis family protein
MNNNSSVTSQSSNEVNLNEIIKPYIQKWIWFVISLLVAIALAFLYFKRTVSIYNIQSTILIKDAKKSSGDYGMLSELSGLNSMGTTSIDNEIEVLKSKKLMGDVVTQLGIQTSVFAKDGMKEKELYMATSPVIVRVINEKKFENTIISPLNLTIKGDKIALTSENLKGSIHTTFNKTINLPYANIIITKNKGFISDGKDLEELNIKYSKKEITVANLQKITNIKLVEKEATVISLSINYANREKAKAILNTLINVYNMDAIKDKNSESMRTKEFIDERIALISDELGQVEGQKEQFKVANKITDIAAEASLSLQASAESNARLIENATQMQLTSDLMSYLTHQGANQTLPTNIGLGDQEAGSAITIYNQLILERNRLLENATPQNPLVIDLTKKINVLKSSITDGLNKSRDALLLTKNQLENEKGIVSSKIAKIPALEKMFRGIDRQQQVKESLYLLLLQKREETAISLAVTAPKARIVDYAYSSEKPVSPKKMVVLMTMMFLGFCVPFSIIYLKKLLNSKISNKKDIEKMSSTSIVGEIPQLERKDNDLVQQNDVSPISEAFRILRTNMIYMLAKKEKGNIIFVTSTVKGEGKTFVAINLALTLASASKRVLLIGSDIRNPQLQRYDTDKKHATGLSEYLYDEHLNVESIINASTFNKNCDIIYSGAIPPNPVELFSNGRYEKLLEQVNSSYDYIILDTAPLMLVTDSFLISELADVTLYVVRSKVTETNLIEFANHQIDAKKIKNVGFVLNDVSKANFGYGSKYGYGYSATEKTFFEKLKEKF